MNSRTRQELISTTGFRIIGFDGEMPRKRRVFARNKFQEPFPRDFLLEKFIGLIRKNKLRNRLRFPVEGEVLAEKRNDSDFPHSAAFRRCFGGKSQLAAAILEHCRARSGFEDVIAACEDVLKTNTQMVTKEKES